MTYRDLITDALQGYLDLDAPVVIRVHDRGAGTWRDVPTGEMLELGSKYHKRGPAIPLELKDLEAAGVKGLNRGRSPRE